VDLHEIARELGINLWKSSSLPEGVAGKLTTHPRHKPGPSGFAIVVRRQDREARQRFTIAHEFVHFLLHSDLLENGEIVDSTEPQRRELYRSNLSDSREARANTLAAEILMPWNLLKPAINERKSRLEILFKVSRDVIDIRLSSQTALRIKRGPAPVSIAIESQFRTLVEKWHKETQHVSSVKKRIEHPAYRRIIEIGRKILPLLFIELHEHPSHWLVALHEITRADPAPEGSTFPEAVEAWLAWGRARGYLN
jgi:hypothetical protein